MTSSIFDSSAISTQLIRPLRAVYCTAMSAFCACLVAPGLSCLLGEMNEDPCSEKNANDAARYASACTKHTIVSPDCEAKE